MTLDYYHHRRPDSRARVIVMWLILAGLAMLFAAGMFGYIMVRLKVASAMSVKVHLPRGTWISTLALICGSITIHRAAVAVRNERLREFRLYLRITTVLAVVFLAIQTPCMIELLREHEALMSTNMRLYGLIFVLILLHALHVVGGVVALTVVNIGALRNRYDHENYVPVEQAALYWHFLDVVWIVMFTIFMVMA